MADVRRCVRCRRASGVVQVREVVYCGSCYTRVFSEKTRASLELVRGAVLLQSLVEPWARGDAHPPPPAFAVAFSGGTSSCVLLHAIAQSFQSGGQPYVPARAPEFARIDALFVDDGSMAVDDARALAHRLAPNAEFVPLPLANVYEAGAVACTLEPRHGPRWLEAQPVSCDAADALQALLGAVHPTDTLRTGVAAARTRAEDLRAIFTRRILLCAAQERGCAALLYGHSAARSAALLLEGLAKGAGHKLPIESAPSQWWVGSRDVLVVHPLRTHLPDELAYYARAHGFGPPDEEKDWSYDANADKSSIGRLTQSLVDSLQHGVSSTVSTIAGTGSKLVFRPDTVWHVEEQGAQVASSDAVPIVPGATPSSPSYPRIGTKGGLLVQAAQSANRYDPDAELRVCPLCTYPAQRDAAQWRAARSVTSYEATSGGACNAALDLRTRLCYSCLQVLDVPERSAHDAACAPTPVLLPRYVLDAVQPRARHARAPRTTEASEELWELEEPHVPGGRASHVPEPVSREAMRASLAPYLL